MRPLKAISNYFKGVATEMRKVVWPDFRTLMRYFFSVLLGMALATAFVGAVDYVFIHALALIIK